MSPALARFKSPAHASAVASVPSSASGPTLASPSLAAYDGSYLEAKRILNAMLNKRTGEAARKVTFAHTPPSTTHAHAPSPLFVPSSPVSRRVSPSPTSAASSAPPLYRARTGSDAALPLPSHAHTRSKSLFNPLEEPDSEYILPPSRSPALMVTLPTGSPHSHTAATPTSGSHSQPTTPKTPKTPHGWVSPAASPRHSSSPMKGSIQFALPSPLRAKLAAATANGVGAGSRPFHFGRNRSTPASPNMSPSLQHSVPAMSPPALDLPPHSLGAATATSFAVPAPRQPMRSVPNRPPRAHMRSRSLSGL
eukprot:TRINITY_DN4027_c0_g1_i6.p1 TRINITY_DN4027_c0_g1~~TRINITY_DN4027_c0_g1_i6.p1  ORF type:complete len:317 (+),score=66.29 TRINITY_DN4027_c0_g1_i6:29-952(+)